MILFRNGYAKDPSEMLVQFRGLRCYGRGRNAFRPLAKIPSKKIEERFSPPPIRNIFLPTRQKSRFAARGVLFVKIRCGNGIYARGLVHS